LLPPGAGPVVLSATTVSAAPVLKLPRMSRSDKRGTGNRAEPPGPAAKAPPPAEEEDDEAAAPTAVGIAVAADCASWWRAVATPVDTRSPNATAVSRILLLADATADDASEDKPKPDSLKLPDAACRPPPALPAPGAPDAAAAGVPLAAAWLADDDAAAVDAAAGAAAAPLMPAVILPPAAAPVRVGGVAAGGRAPAVLAGERAAGAPPVPAAAPVGFAAADPGDPAVGGTAARLLSVPNTEPPESPDSSEPLLLLPAPFAGVCLDILR